MVNKYFSGITNTENILWLRLKPKIEVVQKINKIVGAIDTDFGEAIFDPDEKLEKYDDFYPKRYSHQHSNKIYAISIFHKDLIDFIIIKNSPIFNQVFELYREEFEN